MNDDRGGRRLIRPALAFLLACLAGCYEQPVVERLSVAFLPDGGVRVGVTHRISVPPAGNNPALDARLEETRRALLEGGDDWGRAFASLRPLTERCSWEKREGGLVRHERSAVLDGPGQLREFFGRTALRASCRIAGENAEFTVVPAGITRASRSQRDRVEREMEAWSAAVEAYLARARALFVYLDGHPDRTRAGFGQIFSDCLTEQERAALPEPSPEEEPLLKGMVEAMTPVLEVLNVPNGEAYTLDELSHLAFNPFPTEFAVEAPAPLIEVEGFERTGERTARVPGLGIWEAYTVVRRRWLDPDPLQAYLEAVLGGDETPFDLDGFCALPRQSADPPHSREVREALAAALTPAAIYRLVWKVPGSGEENGSPTAPTAGQTTENTPR